MLTEKARMQALQRQVHLAIVQLTEHNPASTLAKLQEHLEAEHQVALSLSVERARETLTSLLTQLATIRTKLEAK